LKELREDLAKLGVVLALARVTEELHNDLRRLGVADVIGSDRIFASRTACVEAYRTHYGT